MHVPRHRLDEILLARAREILERLCGLAAGQRLEREHLFVKMEPKERVGQVLRAGLFD